FLFCHLSPFCLFPCIRSPPTSTLFPYTTLFRSLPGPRTLLLINATAQRYLRALARQIQCWIRRPGRLPTYRAAPDRDTKTGSWSVRGGRTAERFVVGSSRRPV